MKPNESDGKRKPKTQHNGLFISKMTIDRILREERAADLLALYMFYANIGLWQGTNQPRASVAYVMKGLKWGKDQVRAVRLGLKQLGLIEDVVRVDSSGRKKGWYVKVAFYHPTDLPEGGSAGGWIPDPQMLPTLNKTRRTGTRTSLRAGTQTAKNALRADTRNARAFRAGSLKEFSEEERGIISSYNESLHEIDGRWLRVIAALKASAMLSAITSALTVAEGQRICGRFSSPLPR